MRMATRLWVRSPLRSGGWDSAHRTAASACSRASWNITCSRWVRSRRGASASRSRAGAPSAGGTASGADSRRGRRRRRGGCRSMGELFRRAGAHFPPDRTAPARAEPAPTMAELTPMMQQYRSLREQHPDAILLFRLGDFFEAFFEDAHLVARELQLTLTSRPVAKGRRIPMCGIPHHALRTYLRRLIDRGHRVAICDQVEDPRQAGSLVRREVVRVVTPGTVIEDDLLSARENNFLASTLEHGEAWGLALADLSTGEFYAAEGSTARHLEETLARFRPREILVPDGASGAPAAATPYDGWRFDLRTAERALCEQLGVATLDAFGLRDAPLATAAAGALVQYLRETQKGSLPHLRGLRLIAPADGLVIDEATRRALALWRVPGEERGETLLDVLDLTETPMGGRLLRRWLARPLLDLAAIAARQDAVEALAAHGAAREALRTRLRALGDLERLTGRLAHEAGSPRDLASLRDTLDALPAVAPCLEGCGAAALAALRPALAPAPELAGLLRRALADAPPLSPREGGLIRPG